MGPDGVHAVELPPLLQGSGGDVNAD